MYFIFAIFSVAANDVTANKRKVYDKQNKYFMQKIEPEIVPVTS